MITTNTLKTHISSSFRNLYVTRRINCTRLTNVGSIDRRKGKSKQLSFSLSLEREISPAFPACNKRPGCAEGCVAAPRVAWSWTRVVRALVRLDSRVGAVVTVALLSLSLPLSFSLSSFFAHTLRASRELFSFSLPLSDPVQFRATFESDSFLCLHSILSR